MTEWLGLFDAFWRFGNLQAESGVLLSVTCAALQDGTEVANPTAEVLVNFKPLPFIPQVRTRVLRIQAIPDQWCSEAVASSNYGFLRVWLEREEQAQATINWGAISGLAISLVVSAGFWAGVALAIEKIWK